MVIRPVAAPAVVGLNSILSVVVSFGANVIGKALADMMNSPPVNVAKLIVTADAPVDFNITVCVEGVFNSTLPNATLDDWTLSVRIPGFTLSGLAFERPAALASSATACGESTDEISAMNPTLLVLLGAGMIVGSITAELLLGNFTPSPPAASASGVTVHGTERDPAIDSLLQDVAFKPGGRCSA